MTDPAAVKARLLATFRDFRVDGVPASGANEPDKGEIRFALDDVVDLAAVSTATKAVATKAELASVPSPALRDSVLVTNDPLGDVTNGNGLYSWSGSAWTWIRPQTDPTVAMKLDPLDEWSRVLARGADLTLVGRYEQANGSFSSTLTFKASPLLPVEGGRQYSITATTSGTAASAWFDKDKVFISSFGVNQAFGTTITVTAPDNARFVGLTNNSSSTTMAAFSARSVSGSFNLPALKKAVDQIREPRDAVVASKLDPLDEWSRVLAKPSDLTLVGRYEQANGAFSSTLTFKASPLLPVEGGRQYSITATTSGTAASAWFDKDKVFISSFGVAQANGSTITVTAPENARFVGLTTHADFVSAFAARSSTGSFNLPALKKAVDQIREPRDAVVDAKTSILQSENDALAARVDMLLGRLGNRYAMGNRVLGIGDSTMRGTYGGDAEPGVNGSTLIAAGDSWISHMCFSTRQKITRVANAGHIGATVADELSRFDDYVVSRKPQTVLISGGTNDVALSPQTTPAAFRGTIEAMIVKARSAGITPVLVTPLPSANSPLYSILTAYNAELLALADKHNLLYLDLYNFARDPATGGLKAEYSGDGVHPR
ncbi:SGNH/GDSL hydrolase family protein [Brevundimonas sp.]|uniref:SGNH/GDSL hydrolase family protein n=1 Tax=Brevundimonas sp. TaxID=1871086 RepID=UPI0035B19BB7